MAEPHDETMSTSFSSSSSSYSTSSANERSATGHSDSDDEREEGNLEYNNVTGAPDDDNQELLVDANDVIPHEFGFKGWVIRTLRRPVSCCQRKQKVRVDDGNGYRMVDSDSVMVPKVPYKQIGLAFALLVFGLGMFVLGCWILTEQEWIRGICVLLLSLIAFAPGLYYSLLTASAWQRGDWSQFDPDD
eukprot:TRINITY_DN6892_c0_g1_i1.p1 TRINITY_DN6892_c0_g1~~TRINITY_DN6892_c0_g1_i1.p1  ORF type:complete len:189 (+),score=31.72 TRINITY_DN6892_c0_g1_i1:127-693(+)